MVGYSFDSAMDYLAFLRGPQADPAFAPGGKYGDLNKAYPGKSPQLKSVHLLPSAYGRWLLDYDDPAELERALKSKNPDLFGGDALKAVMSTSTHYELFYKRDDKGKVESAATGQRYTLYIEPTELKAGEKDAMNKAWDRPGKDALYKLSAEEKKLRLMGLNRC
jgi:hypothetical protein